MILLFKNGHNCASLTVSGFRQNGHNCAGHNCADWLYTYFGLFGHFWKFFTLFILSGNGRPFIIELLKPRALLTSECAEILAAKVNKNQDLKIKDVCIIEKSSCKTLLEGEVDKKKEYRAYCYSERKITQEDLEKLTMSEVVLKVCSLTPAVKVTI